MAVNKKSHRNFSVEMFPGLVSSAFVGLALLVPAAHGSQILPGTRAALYGDLVGKSDFHVVLHPPVQTIQDVKESVDEMMQREDMVRAANEEMFNEDKQHMVSQEKRQIRGLVLETLRSILSKRSL